MQMPVRDWFEQRSFQHQDFSGLASSDEAMRRPAITLILPAREVAATIGPILDTGRCVVRLRRRIADELKRRLVRSQAERLRRIETGELKVIGVNSFTETAPSPLLGDGEIENILRVDHNVESEQIVDLERWRDRRDGAKVRRCARRAAAGGRGRWSRGQRHAGDHRPGPCRRHDRGVGRGVARGVRRVPAPDRRRWRRGTPRRRPRAGPVRAPGAGRAHGRAAPPARGQARPRRALERCRADRGGGARTPGSR